MQTAEILAPAGSRDALVAAVSSGADAVYLGIGDFNARRNASNFSLTDLESVIEYCHIRGVKVHLTLNTLVSDAELPRVLKLVECGCALGVDAFIIQDLGLARLVHAIAPEMPLHASTQMAVMNAAGFRLLESLGFTRAVLPRELSFSEISEIAAQTSLELEMFVHGALCMCVSGQCYLSAMLGGRSGNRGLCAQPCRLGFAAPGGTGHDLSLKDLSLISYLPKLQEAGICSFKIEGRMKRPEYVAAAGTACQNALNGTPDPGLSSQLKAVFSRSGFTDGYFTAARGKEMFGIRQKEDVLAAEPILNSLSALYREDTRQAEVTFSFAAKVGFPMTLTAECVTEYGLITATVKSDTPVEKAQKKATTKESVEKQLQKTGGTGFLVKEMQIQMEEDCFLPLSALNELRRTALHTLSDKLLSCGKKQCLTENAVLPDALPLLKERKGLPIPATESRIPYAKSDTGKPFLLRLSSFVQLPDTWLKYPTEDAVTGAASSSKEAASSCKNSVSPRPILILPIQTPEHQLLQLKQSGLLYGLELPRALYGEQKKIKEQIAHAKALGARFLLVGNLDGVALAKEAGLPLLAGFGINAFNSLTINELHSLGLRGTVVSPELTKEQIAALRGQGCRGLFAYGRLPLMLTRNCPIQNGTDCGTCNGTRSLTDRKGISFPVRCNNGAAELLNSRPIYLADKLDAFSGLDFYLLYCTVESAEEVQAVLHAYQTKKPASGEFTRGLSFRGVL